MNTMIKLAKVKDKFQEGDKIMIVASQLEFNHDILTVVESEVKAQEFMEYAANILSSNEEMTVINIKIINMARGRK